MNSDDFEKRLQRQPMRQLPSEWREKILQTARPLRPSPLDSRPSLLSTLNFKLSTLLWPHPKAWAGLAAVWLVIAAGYFASGDSTMRVAKKPEPPSSETLVILQQQQRLLAELVGPITPRDADRPKRNTAQPRSERRMEILIA